ncbi:DinB family protein [Angustibacter sp. McL0619]|uniref:DinB family protein n=1 Tax=Angustibacter sp. McL0619 TaxID=3415676 RepID=UPI003CF5F9C1
MPISADTKDWTWVIDRRCPDCGFDAAELDAADVPELVRENAAAWQAVLTRQDVGRRPDQSTWSPLEYACHVVDVHQVFGRRFDLMLSEDDPTFENWDQDQSALDGHYATRDPAQVALDLATCAEVVASTLDAVHGRQWKRPGRRSNGSVFTVASLARYYAHDIVHHQWDVRG